MFQITPIVRNLLIINVIVYIVDKNLLMLSPQFSLRSFLSPYFMPYQFVSYMFLHANFGHLLGNMFGLFMFGPLLERVWGSKRFLFFYFFTGIGAGLLFSGINYFEVSGLKRDMEIFLSHPAPQTLIDFLVMHAKQIYQANQSFINNFEANPDSARYLAESKSLVTNIYDAYVNMPMVGASGAIFGILMAFGLLFPNTELFLLFFPFPIKAKYFVTFYGLYSLYAGFQNAPNDNVAHFAHVGGMLFAYLLLRYWNSQRQKFF